VTERGKSRSRLQSAEEVRWSLETPDPCNGTPKSAGRLKGRRPLLYFASRFRAGDIVVTASDTDYAVTYHKPATSSQLLAKSYPRKDDRRVSLTLAQFLTDAWKLAKDKASELGW
jgi:hypothetical protein